MNPFTTKAVSFKVAVFFAACTLIIVLILTACVVIKKSGGHSGKNGTTTSYSNNSTNNPDVTIRVPVQQLSGPKLENFSNANILEEMNTWVKQKIVNCSVAESSFNSNYFQLKPDSNQLVHEQNLTRILDSTSNLSCVRFKKLCVLFRDVLDMDRSGALEDQDFFLISQNISRIMIWSLEELDGVLSMKRLMGLWDILRSYSGKSENKSIALAEFVLILNGPARNPKWLPLFLSRLFEVIESSGEGDGLLDLQEYMDFCSVVMKVPNEESQNTYDKISRNGSVTLSSLEFVNLGLEYFRSDNTSALGNDLFCGELLL